MQSQKKTNGSNQAKLNKLMQLLCLRIDELITKLEVRLYPSGNKLVGCCPIHDGDNAAALNIYPEGYAVPGYWVCRTHHCEQKYKATIIGFARGVLSNKHRKEFSFNATIKWLCKFVGQELDDIEIDPDEVQRQQFIAAAHTFQNSTVKKKASRKTKLENT